ncbi:MAG: hypothetical protein U0840_13980 [Gemmataceae bacterium]
MLRQWITVSFLGLLSVVVSAAEPSLLFEDDFSRGMSRWKPTDVKAWKVIDTPEGKALSQFAASKYRPKHRSPLNYALVNDLIVGDFILEARLRSTTRDYGHRDLCLFFGWQSPEKFYYVHLAKKADDRANQVFIVNGKDRAKISKTSTPGTPWTDGWHRVKLVRKVKDGTVEVYFDDMKKPIMTASDTTFSWGQIGVGSFDDTGDWRTVQIRGVRVEKPE